MNMENQTLQIEKLPHYKNLKLPAYQSLHSAGMDLYAALEEPITIESGGRVLIPSGLKMAIPKGFEAQIRPRSGLALKHGITLLNTPGTIDADYRGEVKILVINLGETAYTINHGDRMAQLILAPVTRVPIMEVNNLPETKRGKGGFGSTGVR